MSTQSLIPGQLIAEIPGVLGFYPQEALVIMLFQQIGPTQYQLGPVLRSDLNAVDLDELSGMLTDDFFPTDLALAVMISENDISVHNTVGMLRDTCLANLAAVWSLPSIYTGAPYAAAWVAPEAANALTWHAGRVSPITATTSLKTLAGRGQMPMLSREEASTQFKANSNDHLSADELGWITAEVGSQLDHLYDGDNLRDVDAVRGLLRDLEEFLSDGRVFSCDQWQRDPGALAVATTALAQTDLRVRDVAVGILTRAGAAGAELALAVTTTTEDDATRANALCAWALVHHVDPLAALALQQALETCPNHNLAQLLTEGQTHGALDCLATEGVPAGVSIARAQLGVANP